MTREEAIKMLRGMKADNLNLDDLYTRDKYEALVMAIKSLEQRTDVLDEIKAEIVELDNKLCQQSLLDNKFCPQVFLSEDVDRKVHRTYRECIEIIDKYKAERKEEK